MFIGEKYPAGLLRPALAWLLCSPGEKCFSRSNISLRHPSVTTENLAANQSRCRLHHDRNKYPCPFHFKGGCGVSFLKGFVPIVCLTIPSGLKPSAGHRKSTSSTFAISNICVAISFIFTGYRTGCNRAAIGRISGSTMGLCSFCLR